MASGILDQSKGQLYVLDIFALTCQTAWGAKKKKERWVSVTNKKDPSDSRHSARKSQHADERPHEYD